MKKVFVLTALASSLLFTTTASAQCAMCRMNAENASKENAGIGQGLNDGIIYLMGIPYLLLGVGAVAFFRHRKSLIPDNG